MSWWISFTPARDSGFVAWATERPPPRHATVRSMLLFPGEVHFAFGDTIEAARDRLEAELPPAPGLS